MSGCFFWTQCSNFFISVFLCTVHTFSVPFLVGDVSLFQSTPGSPRGVVGSCWIFLLARCRSWLGHGLDTVAPGQHCSSVDRWRILGIWSGRDSLPAMENGRTSDSPCMCCLSVRLSVCLSLKSKTEKCTKAKNGLNVLQHKNNWCASFQFKISGL